MLRSVDAHEKVYRHCPDFTLFKGTTEYECPLCRKKMVPDNIDITKLDQEQGYDYRLLNPQSRDHTLCGTQD